MTYTKEQLQEILRKHKLMSLHPRLVSPKIKP